MKIKARYSAYIGIEWEYDMDDPLLRSEDDLKEMFYHSNEIECVLQQILDENVDGKVTVIKLFSELWKGGEKDDNRKNV